MEPMASTEMKVSEGSAHGGVEEVCLRLKPTKQSTEGCTTEKNFKLTVDFRQDVVLPRMSAGNEAAAGSHVGQTDPGRMKLRLVLLLLLLAVDDSVVRRDPLRRGWGGRP